MELHEERFRLEVLVLLAVELGELFVVLGGQGRVVHGEEEDEEEDEDAKPNEVMLEGMREEGGGKTEVKRGKRTYW